MRNRNRRWLLAWTLASLFPHIMLYEIGKEANDVSKSNSSNGKELRGIFAPRMDYEQWTPLGRGDPLKNDPTYDYVPPVLDRVHYWIDSASRKPDPPLPSDSQKTEILVLGVSSKKPSSSSALVADSRKDYDPFLKFVEGPKFGIQNNYQRMSRPHYSMSSYYPSSLFTNKNVQNELVPGSEQRVPYTMLMPPPVHKLETITVHQTANSLAGTTEYPTTKAVLRPSTSSASLTSAPSFTIEQSKLVYHSSTLGSQDEFRDKSQFGTLGASSSQVTWRTPLAHPNFTKELRKPQRQTESKQNFSSTDIKVNSNTKPVVPLLRDTEIMHKGQVTDDDLDIFNIYVNIGKPEAQMHSPTDLEISGVSMQPPQIPVRQPPVLMRPVTPQSIMHLSETMQSDFRNPTVMMTKPQITPMTLQTLQTMQTMKAPPISQPLMSFTSKPTTSSLSGLLQKETVSLLSTMLPTRSSQFFTLLRGPRPKLTTTTPVTTPAPTTTTTTTSLTTDPLFKHYKQPTEPLKGPLYLIIQGHSKVKTYGPGKQIHGIAIQETNEIPGSDDREDYTVKHLHGFNKKDMNEGRLRQGRSSKLQTLSHVVETGLGAIDFTEAATSKKKVEDVQEAELVVKYDVSSQAETTSERYYKGIVEAGDMARKIKSARRA